ncbi:sigma-70 family RNA polymerase sigma factor [Longimicrobium sp.]|uniref:sigma-70 family RNA polymerase sigma factor n=1 Tax=Longimicrobium sp. TaxID=2029185 RepID=UPI0039C9AC2B
MNTDNVRSDPSKLFQEHLEWIDQIARKAAVRHGMSRDEANDFVSWIHLQLLENNYAALRHYRGTSSFRTFLAVVIASLTIEYQRSRLGRWRASAAALRLGPVAVRLERLIYREGYSLQQAAEVLNSQGITTSGATELGRLLGHLPTREPLRPSSVDIEGSEADGRVLASEADDRVLASEAERERVRILSVLTRVLATLPVEDQVIARFRFFEGLSIGDIARALNVESKPLYRRVDRLLRNLRSALEHEGIDAQRVSAALSESPDP